MAYRILVIEDSRSILELVTDILNRLYEVDVLPSGIGWENKLESFRPDLVVLDLMLPEVSGIKICEMMRKRTDSANMPILLLSAAGREEIMAGMRAGANRFLAKPFDPNVFLGVVSEMLTGSWSGKTPTR